MNDYISREAALEAAMTYCPDDDGSCSKAGEDIRSLLDELESIPAADVRPVERGRWIVHYDDLWPTESTQECSECHEEVPLLIDCKFCPNCGAQMGGDAE